MIIDTKLSDRICRHARGGYLGLSWAITDAEGNRTDTMRPGGFVVAENYYGYAILRINDDMTLTECRCEEE